MPPQSHPYMTLRPRKRKASPTAQSHKVSMPDQLSDYWTPGAIPAICIPIPPTRAAKEGHKDCKQAETLANARESIGVERSRETSKGGSENGLKEESPEVRAIKDIEGEGKCRCKCKCKCAEECQCKCWCKAQCSCEGECKCKYLCRCECDCNPVCLCLCGCNAGRTEQLTKEGMTDKGLIEGYVGQGLATRVNGEDKGPESGTKSINGPREQKFRLAEEEPDVKVKRKAEPQTKLMYVRPKVGMSAGEQERRPDRFLLMATSETVSSTILMEEAQSEHRKPKLEAKEEFN